MLLTSVKVTNLLKYYNSAQVASSINGVYMSVQWFRTVTSQQEGPGFEHCAGFKCPSCLNLS